MPRRSKTLSLNTDGLRPGLILPAWDPTRADCDTCGTPAIVGKQRILKGDRFSTILWRCGPCLTGHKPERTTPPRELPRKEKRSDGKVLVRVVREY